MSQKTKELKPRGLLSADEKNELYPFGVCGLGVSSQAILLPGQVKGTIQQPNAMQVQVQVIPVEPACCGPDCQLWIGDGDGWCCFRHLGRLRELVELSTPAGPDLFPADREPRKVRDVLAENRHREKEGD